VILSDCLNSSDQTKPVPVSENHADFVVRQQLPAVEHSSFTTDVFVVCRRQVADIQPTAAAANVHPIEEAAGPSHQLCSAAGARQRLSGSGATNQPEEAEDFTGAAARHVVHRRSADRSTSAAVCLFSHVHREQPLLEPGGSAWK